MLDVCLCFHRTVICRINRINKTNCYKFLHLKQCNNHHKLSGRLTDLVLTLVVGAGDLDLLDVGVDDALVVADGLDKEKLVPLLLDDSFVQELAAGHGAVRRVKDGDLMEKETSLMFSSPTSLSSLHTFLAWNELMSSELTYFSRRHMPEWVFHFMGEVGKKRC